MAQRRKTTGGGNYFPPRPLHAERFCMQETKFINNTRKMCRGGRAYLARRRRRLASGAAVEAVAASWLTDGGSGGTTAVSHGSSSFPGSLLLFRFLEFPIGFKFSQASQFWVFGGCFLSSVVSLSLRFFCSLRVPLLFFFFVPLSSFVSSLFIGARCGDHW